MACLTIRHFPRMRSHRTRTTHSLVPSADYFTTTLKTYAYNKNSVQTLTSVARLALNRRTVVLRRVLHLSVVHCVSLVGLLIFWYRSTEKISFWNGYLRRLYGYSSVVSTKFHFSTHLHCMQCKKSVLLRRLDMGLRGCWSASFWWSAGVLPRSIDRVVRVLI